MSNPSSKLSQKSQQDNSEQSQELLQLVEQIFRGYAPGVDPSRWPWEKTRWYELIFCILFSIGEPDVPAAAIRELTKILVDFGLLEVGSIAAWKGDEKAREEKLTVKTLLEKAGFTSENATKSLKFMEEVAVQLHKDHNGKIQNYLRQYGEAMLLEMKQDLRLEKHPSSHQALSLWLQNILNMPIPATDPIAEKACRNLGVEYKDLVEAATVQDINIALLDDALRSYWENEVEEN